MGSIVDQVRIRQDFGSDGYTFEVLPSEEGKPECLDLDLGTGDFTMESWAECTIGRRTYLENYAPPPMEYVAGTLVDSLLDKTVSAVPSLARLAEGYGMGQYKVLLLEDDTMRHVDEEKYMDPHTLRDMGEAYARIEAFLAWSSDWAQRNEVCSDTFDGYLLLHNLVAQQQRTGPHLSDVQFMTMLKQLRQHRKATLFDIGMGSCLG